MSDYLDFLKENTVTTIILGALAAPIVMVLLGIFVYFAIKLPYLALVFLTGNEIFAGVFIMVTILFTIMGSILAVIMKVYS